MRRFSLYYLVAVFGELNTKCKLTSKRNSVSVNHVHVEGWHPCWGTSLSFFWNICSSKFCFINIRSKWKLYYEFGWGTSRMCTAFIFSGFQDEFIDGIKSNNVFNHPCKTVDVDILQTLLNRRSKRNARHTWNQCNQCCVLCA